MIDVVDVMVIHMLWIMSDEKSVIMHRKIVGNIRKWIGQSIFQQFTNDTS